MLRILIVSQDTTTGPSIFWKNLVNALSKKYEVRLLNPQAPIILSSKVISSVFGIMLHSFQIMFFDAIIISDVAFVGCLYTILGKLLRKKIIFVPVGLYYLEYILEDLSFEGMITRRILVLKKILARIYKISEIAIFSLADVIISSTRSFTEYALNKRFLRARLIELDLGCVDCNLFMRSENARIAVRTRLGIPNDHTVLLYVGHLTKYSGIHVALHIFKKLQIRDNIWLIIIGRGILEKWVKAEVKNLKRAIFIGYVRHDEVSHYMAASDILIYPRREPVAGLGNILKEALCSGLPVIAFETNATRTRPSPAIIVVRNANEMLSKVTRLIDNPQAIRELGEKARVHALKNFSCETLSDKLTMLINLTERT